MPSDSAADLTLLRDVSAEVGKIVLGKSRQIQQTLCCLLAGGHILVEDLPGVGKTTLAQVFAKVIGLGYQRLQFTSDLLPSDVLGVSVFDRNTNAFHFHPGPVFTEFLLVDEINRASPKTQSALLEAMAEQQVTIEGETRALPNPFFVMATQNPWFQSGTFPLPEDRQADGSPHCRKAP
jgi:MoxR-like ATPase